MAPLKSHQIIAREDEALRVRRQKLHGQAEAEKLPKNRFGIALSGGGIRSATINLGFLKTLNYFHLLERADYLSTVSGGGYTGSYVQATAKQTGDFNQLFTDEHTDYLREHGDYLMPGSGRTKLINTFLLVVGFLVSLTMSLIGPAAIICSGVFLYYIIGGLFDFNTLFGDFLQNSLNWIQQNELKTYLFAGFGMVLLAHFIVNVRYKYDLKYSRLFNRIEYYFLLLILVFLGALWLLDTEALPALAQEEYLRYGLAIPVLILAGFFADPNALSFHRFYRTQLADAFLHFAGEYKNARLGVFFHPENDDKADYLAPYPLINTCLNLRGIGDSKYMGAKASDYFLLSPKFCGSKLTGYVETRETDFYRNMTLPAAATISAAAMNPGMGMYTGTVTRILMTLFNARLGFWADNPDNLKPKKWIWWPVYFFRELLGKMGSEYPKVNISDGGHIENLAVYELLRRKCRLIIASDAGADPKFTFEDLERLVIRARNELGLEIAFRPNQKPEEVIKPSASQGYSDRRFAIADILQVWEEFLLTDRKEQIITFRQKNSEGKLEERPVEILVNYFYDDNKELEDFFVEPKVAPSEFVTQADIDAWSEMGIAMVEEKLNKSENPKQVKVGTLVYVKSAVTAPPKPYLPRVDRERSKSKFYQFHTFKYKIYRPDFPHEPTSDQFFDPVQWEAYFQLGQHIAKDILDIYRFYEYQSGERKGFDISADELIAHFDQGFDLFAAEKAAETVAPEEVTPVVVEDETGEEIFLQPKSVKAKEIKKDRKDLRYSM